MTRRIKVWLTRTIAGALVVLTPVVGLAVAGRPAAAAANNLLYNGAHGPVIHHLKVHEIFWLPAGYNYESAADAAGNTRGEPANPCNTSGKTGNGHYECLMEEFVRDLTNSPFYAVNGQYPDQSGTPPGPDVQLLDDPLNPTVDTAGYPATVTTAKPSLARSDVANEVARVVKAKGWTEDTDTVFAVFTAEGVPSDGTGGGSYHDEFSDPNTGQLTNFVAVGASFSVSAPYPNGDAQADGQIPVLAHELFESVTDPAARINRKAWVDSADQEIADKCGPINDDPPTNDAGANTYLNGRPWHVGTMWSNVVGGCASDRCALSDCRPTISVQVTATPQVTTGDPITYSVDITNTSDTAPAVGVAITDALPLGLTYLPGSATVVAGAAGVAVTQNGQTLIISPRRNPADGASIDEALSHSEPVHQRTLITFQATSDGAAQNGAVVQNCAAVSWTDRIAAGDNGGGPAALIGQLHPASTIRCAITTLVNLPPTLILPGDQRVDYHDLLTFVVTATDPEATDTLTFGQSGLPAGLTLTDNGDRTATVSGSPEVAPGTYSVTFNVSDAHNPPVTNTLDIVVEREESSLSYAGDTRVANGTAANLSVRLTEDGVSPIANRQVSITLGTGGQAQTCSATTDGAGLGRCTIASVAQPLVGQGDVPAVATFGGDQYYLPSSAVAKTMLLYLTGHAVALRNNGLLLGSLVLADTGPVTTPSASDTQRSLARATAPFVTAFGLVTKVSTTVAPGSAQAQASAATVTVAVPGIPVLQLSAVQATSRSTCAASTGRTNITLRAAGLGLSVATNPGPNTEIDLGLARIILNEQILATDPARGTRQLTVNAMHFITPLADLVVASTTSDIHNC